MQKFKYSSGNSNWKTFSSWVRAVRRRWSKEENGGDGLTQKESSSFFWSFWAVTCSSRDEMSMGGNVL